MFFNVDPAVFENGGGLVVLEYGLALGVAEVLSM